MDDGRDLNLNNDYFVMYGTDEDPASGPLASLGRHDTTPILTAQRFNIAADVTPPTGDTPVVEGVVAPVSESMMSPWLYDC